MQIEGSIDPQVEKRIVDIITENYEESMATLINIAVTHVLDDRVYIANVVTSWEGDDEYTVHTETIRVDRKPLNQTEGFLYTFTLLSEHDLDLIEEL